MSVNNVAGRICVRAKPGKGTLIPLGYEISVLNGVNYFTGCVFDTVPKLIYRLLIAQLSVSPRVGAKTRKWRLRSATSANRGKVSVVAHEARVKEPFKHVTVAKMV